MKQLVRLALQRPDSLIVPVMEVNVELELIEGFFEAFMSFSRFIPLVALIDDAIVTGVELSPLGLSIKGHKLERQL